MGSNPSHPSQSQLQAGIKSTQPPLSLLVSHTHFPPERCPAHRLYIHSRRPVRVCLVKERGPDLGIMVNLAGVLDEAKKEVLIFAVIFRGDLDDLRRIQPFPLPGKTTAHQPSENAWSLAP